MNRMNEHLAHVTVSAHQPTPARLKRYVFGYSYSLALTVLAYLLAVHRALPLEWLVVVVVFLALVQFLIQLRYFLHLGEEFPPKFKLAAFIGMVVVVFIVVGGTLWVMHNLDGRVMNKRQELQYMKNQDSL